MVRPPDGDTRTSRHATRAPVPASALYYLPSNGFGDGATFEDQPSAPTRYCMCLKCGQELWADSATTSVVDCFACRAPLASPSGGGGKLPLPQATSAADLEDVFLGTLRKSRSLRRSSDPSLRKVGQKIVSQTPASKSGLGQDPPTPSQVEPPASLHSVSRGGVPEQQGPGGHRLEASGADGFGLGPRRQTRSEDVADADGTASGRPRRRAAGMPMQSPSTSSLLRIGQPLLKPSPPMPTGNHVLDGVLGKLSKPKLMGALDRVVKEAALKEFDLDGDGILSDEEMAIGLRKLGVSLLPAEFDAFVRALDVDQKGMVLVDELLWIVSLYRSHFQLDQRSDRTTAEPRAEDPDLGPPRPPRAEDEADAGGASGAPPRRSPRQASKPPGRQAQGRDLHAPAASPSRREPEARRELPGEAHGRGGRPRPAALGAPRQARSKDAPGVEGAAGGTPSGDSAAGRLVPSPNGLSLPRIAQRASQPSPPTPTGNATLDLVLGKLGKPKLLAAFDRMVKESWPPGRRRCRRRSESSTSTATASSARTRWPSGSESWGSQCFRRSSMRS
ncbi:unnamed protein product [Prorocentrum cordatum]|uniref:EF-hand domain-containing protein n=1 Tax=Prorocentrum cordatum TaxID=2364126 RepID=A0ABN9USU7_9DINO|nr:unnamed protein product [Polarella glacialis]